ncbi:MAG: hypothetical protein ACLPX5_07505 [Dissulfurispiraceae bacterium]
MRTTVILLFCMLLLFMSQSSAEEKRYQVPLEDSPSYGSGEAPVTMIEFIDYQ